MWLSQKNREGSESRFSAWGEGETCGLVHFRERFRALGKLHRLGWVHMSIFWGNGKIVVRERSRVESFRGERHRWEMGLWRIGETAKEKKYIRTGDCCIAVIYSYYYGRKKNIYLHRVLTMMEFYLEMRHKTWIDGKLYMPEISLKLTRGWGKKQTRWF